VLETPGLERESESPPRHESLEHFVLHLVEDRALPCSKIDSDRIALVPKTPMTENIHLSNQFARHVQLPPSNEQVPGAAALTAGRCTASARRFTFNISPVKPEDCFEIGDESRLDRLSAVLAGDIVCAGGQGRHELTVGAILGAVVKDETVGDDHCGVRERLELWHAFEKIFDASDANFFSPKRVCLEMVQHVPVQKLCERDRLGVEGCRDVQMYLSHED
jgi:hypothetical protein